MGNIVASDAISLLSFYLALVALLASLFFARLEGWYSDVKVEAKLWDLEPKQNPDLKSIRGHQQKVVSLQSATPILGFLLVSSFLLLITYFGAQLGSTISNSTVPLSFIFIPGGIFEAIFFAGSIWILKTGKGKTDKCLTDIEKALGIRRG